MKKRVPSKIIPKYLKTINDLDNGSKIKVVYWKLKCEENPLPAASKLEILILI